MITTLPITEFEPQPTDTIWDVRDAEAYLLGHIQHAVNVPLDNLEEALNNTEATTIYVLCGGGTKAGKAAEKITQLNESCHVVHLTGGTRGAAAAGWELVKG